MSSTPSFSEFKPLPHQGEIIYDIFNDYDYSTGTKEALLSGSVGSAKSLTLAHIGIRHCLENQNANFAIGRLALPQLKATLCNKIREHLYGTGIPYDYNETKGDFKFYNGSKITAVSWADNNMAKLGSFEFSAGGIEEVTESPTKKAWDTLLMRVGRLPHIDQKFLIGATNPDSPAHWAYKRLVINPDVKVYYSVTTDNPYLDESYINTLIKNLDPKMVKRMVEGEWIEISGENIYHQYERSRNYRNYSYEVVPYLPICLTWDFNIGEGKPLSVAFMQKNAEGWHVFNEVVVDGQRTQDALEEAYERGLFNYRTKYVVRGDRNGKNNDTRNNHSDYEIISNFMAHIRRPDFTKVEYEVQVAKTNPELRYRHNTVNSYFCNGHGESRLFIYRDAPTADEGFRLTKLRKGSQYLEDDSIRSQHITTAIGYAICYDEKNNISSLNENSFGSYKR